MISENGEIQRGRQEVADVFADFYGNLYENSLFCFKNVPKGPQVPIGNPQDDKNCFFELPGYENPMLGKRIFEFSPIKNKLV